jgi:hypothetical protein
MKSPDNRGLQRLPKTLVFITIAFIASSTPIKAQTILTGGEIAFTGYITGAAADSISFIVLRSSGISATTTILFTDNGWLAGGVGRTGEGILEWKADRTFQYGEQVKMWAGSSTVGADQGTVRKVSGNFDLSSGGDQLFAFHGSWPNPTVLIAGFHYNRTVGTTEAGWDMGAASSGSASVYPSTLCTKCGVWVRPADAAVSVITLGAYYKGVYEVAPVEFRARLGNNVNWESSFTNSVPGSPLWTLPPVIQTAGNSGEENPVDTSLPRIIAVATTMPAGTYKAGEEINITLYFNKAVIVNATAGIPALVLNVGNINSKALYVTGSCSSAVTFTYQVQAGDTTNALDYISAGAVALNNGTIQGADARNVNLVLPQPGGGASLAAQKIMKVDARPPVITPYQSFTIDRFAATGAEVGRVLATDEGPAGAGLHDWKIMQGNAGGAFAIDSQTGMIAVANHQGIAEATPGYALVLTVSDGVNTSAPTEMTILFSELAADTILFEPVSFYENQVAGTVTGYLHLRSGSMPVTYSLVTGNGDTHNALFSINGNELRSAEPLNYEVQPEYHVRVRAGLGARHFDTTLVIALLNVNEAPTIDEVPGQIVCSNSNMQQLALTGITGGPEAEQCVTVSATTDKEDFFAQLIVIRETDGTTFLKYKVKEGVSGDAIVTITVKDTGGKANGGVDSTSYSFTITAKAAITINITSDGHTNLSAGETVLLTATTSGLTGSYQWYLNEVAVPGAQEATYRVDVSHAGVYYCQFTGAGGCSSKSNTLLVTNAEEQVSILAYPNPARGKVFLTFSGYQEKYVTVVIYNSAGAEMQRKRIWHANASQKDEIDITGYPAGMYIIEIISEQKEKVGHVSFISS